MKFGANHLCEICGKNRAAVSHTKCSKEKQKLGFPVDPTKIQSQTPSSAKRVAGKTK